MKSDAQREIELARAALRARTDVELKGARRARLWAAIEARRPEPKRSVSAWLRWTLIPAVGFAVVVVFLFSGGSEVALPRAVSGRALFGDRIIEGATLPIGVRFQVAERLAIRLDEKAELDLALGTIATLESSRLLVLEAGALDANIALEAGAPIEVRAGLAHVAAISARFTLTRTNERTAIRVTSGQVELSKGGETDILSSGAEREIETAPIAKLPRADLAPEAPPTVDRSRPPPRPKRAAAPPTETLPSEATPPRSPEELKQEALATLGRADQLRRAGRRLEAAEAYRAAADGLGADAIAEEALFREAELYFELDRLDLALSVLDGLDRRSIAGLLAPERTVLEANIRLRQGRPKEAREALETLGRDRSSIIDDARVRVAEKLLPFDREGACALLDLVLSREAPAALKARAAALRRSCDDAPPPDDVDPKPTAPAAHE